MNKKTLKNDKATDFDEYMDDLLKDPKLKEYYDEVGRQLDSACQLLQMRKKKKMSQKELAKKLGTSQSAVVRMERGNQNFSLKMLGKIADVFGKELKISFE